jgi:circadian clock protein KaiB
LRLHVAGESPNSARAYANLKEILRQHRHMACKVEVIDCLSNPELTLRDGVLVTPTLIRLSPRPLISIMGDLRNHDQVARSLGLDEQVYE